MRAGNASYARVARNSQGRVFQCKSGPTRSECLPHFWDEGEKITVIIRKGNSNVSKTKKEARKASLVGFFPSFTHNSSWHSCFQGVRILRDSAARSGYSLQVFPAKPRTPHVIVSNHQYYIIINSSGTTRTKLLACVYLSNVSVLYCIRQSGLLFRFNFTFSGD